MKKHHVYTVTCNKNPILILEDHIPTWNHELMIALNGTNDNITKLFTEINNRHLTNITINSNLEFHQTNQTTCKTLNRKSIWEVDDISDSTSCKEFGIDNKRKSENIFFFKVRVGILRIANTDDGFLGTHFFS